jgi:uncharacterized membrane protein YfcA
MEFGALLSGGLDPVQIGILSGAALLTSILSAIVGMGGGITLLAVMLIFLDPLVAIPLHATVQLVSNGTRALAQRRHVQWHILGFYALPLAPLGWLSLQLAEQIPPESARALIGAFVLVCTWRPGWLLLGTRPGETNPKLRFLGLGTVVGVVNVTFGATGPLIAPFFLNLGLTRFAIVGTKAACQVVGHAVKIGVFALAGFAFPEWSGLLGLLCLCVIVGTAIGTRLLSRVGEATFLALYKVVLTGVASYLMVRYAGMAAWGAAAL